MWVVVVVWTALLAPPLGSANYCPALVVVVVAVTVAVRSRRRRRRWIVCMVFAAHVRQSRAQSDVDGRLLVVATTATLSFGHVEAYATDTKPLTATRWSGLLWLSFKKMFCM